MRPTILAIALVALAPAALAQTYPPGGAANPGPTAGTGYYPSEPSTPSRSAMNSQPDPQNCGNSRRTQSMPADAAQATTDLSREPLMTLGAG